MRRLASETLLAVSCCFDNSHWQAGDSQKQEIYRQASLPGEDDRVLFHFRKRRFGSK